MSITDENLNATLQLYANPLSIQTNALTRLQESVLNGAEVKDGNNVFTFLLEFMATMTAGAAGEAVNNFSSLYPSKAMTSADLYKHMSDFDYVNLYSTPATTKLTVMFDRNYLINNAVQDTSNKAYHKIIIPSQSTFNVGTMTFGIHYPIQIIIKKNILPNGRVDYDSTTFTVLWDTDQYTPLHRLKTNVLEHRFYNNGGVTLFCIEIPVYQFSVKTYNESIAPSAGFIRRYAFTDKFYAIRIFENSSGNWEEMHQTLSDTIYDTTIPTANVKVLIDTNIVEVVIPQIYINNDMLGNKVMIKVYTSKGDVNVDISNYNMDQFGASFIVDDEVVDTGYSDMLKYINLIQVIPSVSTISGGKNGMNFAELRNRVIHDSTYDVIITPRDLVAYFSDHDYAISKYIDNVTNRIYFAHKLLKDSKGNMIGAGEYNTIFTDSMLKVITDLQTNESYIDNYSNIKHITDDSVMILPTNMYKYDESKNSMILLNDMEISELDKLNKKAKIAAFNNNIYSFSPFHIKLDTKPTPNCVNYDLLKPSISNMTFIGENPNLPTQVSVYSYGITHLNNGSGGYKLYINLYRTDDILTTPITEYYNNLIVKNIMVVLVSVNQEGSTCYTIGEYTGNSNENALPIIEFDISTDYKIMDSDSIHITNFKTNNGISDTYLKLNSSFNIMTFVRTGLLPAGSDSMKQIDTSKFPLETSGYTWLSTQNIDVLLGSKIDMLHNNISMSVGAAKTELQPTTTFATYPRPVYARWTADDVPIGEEDKIGLLKYPLVETHKVGELILSELNGVINPPSCKLKRNQPKQTINVYNSPISDIDIEGVYYLIDSTKSSIDRKWRKTDSISSNSYSSIEYDATVKKWKLIKYNGITPTTIYISNSLTELSTPPPTGWVLPSNTTEETSLIVDFIEYAVDKLYNLVLNTPYTATSWQGNTWTRSPGHLYLHSCGYDTVNGNYILEELKHGGARVWKKTLTINGVELIHRIKFEIPEAPELSRWILTEQSGDNEEITLFFVIDLDPETDPWDEIWFAENEADIKPPKFYLLNYDDTEHTVKIEDLLELLYSRIDSTLTFATMNNVKKYIDSETFKIVDPVSDFTMFLTTKDTIQVPSTEFTTPYVDPSDNTKTVGIGTGALYIRDKELSAFDPTTYLSTEDLYNFFDKYDNPIEIGTIEDSLSLEYSIPKYLVKKIIAWRTPWIKVLEASDVTTIGKYLDSRNINGYSLSVIREIQNKVQNVLKTFTNNDSLQAALPELEDGEVVWVEDISELFTEEDSPMLGTPYTGGPLGAICIIEEVDNVNTVVFVCPANTLEYAKSIISSYGTNSGLVYTIYDKRDTANYILRYVYPLISNSLGIDVNMENTPWQLADKWPWDISSWIDISTYTETNNISIDLDTITTSAIILNKSNETVVENDGTVLEDTKLRNIVYNTSMLHIDYKPMLSSEVQYANYRDTILDNLRQHFNVLGEARSSLLEQTNLFFKPIRTIGNGEFKYTTEETVNMRLDMTMDLRLHVESRVMVSAHIRDMITKNIYNIIASHLSAGTISQTNITRDILDQLGDSIVYIDVLGINGMTDLQTLIPINTSFSPYIRQNLYLKDDGTIGIVSGLNIKWVIV